MSDSNMGIIATAAGNVISSGINAIAQGGMNKKTRKFAEKMYNRQRQDSLSDWTMQNEYNSPTSQMARLREAGLNPNLVYGKGADNTSQAVRSTPAPSWNPKAPQVDIRPGEALMAGYDIKMREAQIDNLKVQNTVSLQEALLKAAQTSQVGAQTARSKFDLEMAQTLKDNSLEMATQELRKLKTGTDISLQENERQAAMNTSSLKEAAERILTMRLGREKARYEMDNLMKDSQLKQLDIDLKEKGIQPTDNIFFRVLGRLLEKYINDVPSLSFPGLPKLKFNDYEQEQLKRAKENWQKWKNTHK